MDSRFRLQGNCGEFGMWQRRTDNRASEKGDMPHKRIETMTSRTAEWTCLSRAVSSFETDRCYKSDDDIAPLLLPDLARLLIRIPFLRRLFPRIAPSKGMYEYLISRTKFIDDVFRQGLGRPVRPGPPPGGRV